MIDFKFEGGYSAVPNNLVGFLSANTVSVFAKLVQCAALQDREKRSATCMSIAQLAVIVRLHRQTVCKAIEELLNLNIIKKMDSSQKDYLFIINWEVVKFLCATLNQLSIGQSQLFKELYSEFVSENYLVKISSNNSDLVKFSPNNEDLMKISTNVEYWVKKSSNNEYLVKISTNNADLVKISPNNFIVYAKNGQILVQKPSEYSKFSKNVEVGTENYSNEEDWSDESVETEDPDEIICRKNHQIMPGFGENFDKSLRIYNNKNKKNCRTSEARPGEGEDRVEKGIIGLIGGMGERREEREKEGRGEETSFSNFSQVEIINFDEPSENTENFSIRSMERKENFQEYKKHFSSTPYSKKPYFNKQEVEKFIADIEMCADSPVKLFLYNFWDELYAYCEENLTAELPVDEYGEETEQPDVNVIGTVIPSETILSMMERAYRDMTEMVMAGFVEMEYGKVDIQCSPDSDIMYFNPALIFDWKITRDEDNISSFTVSYDGIRNIEAADIELPAEVKGVTGDKKAESKINRGFIQALLKSSEETLTPVEKAIRMFCETLLRFDEVGHTVGFKNIAGREMEGNTLPGFLIKPWTLNLQELDITPQDFYDTMAVPYKDGADLRLKSNLFSFQKTQIWNKMHGYESKISHVGDF